VKFDDLFWYIVIFLFLFGGSTAGFVQHLQSRRHKFKLAMAKEKAKLEQAKAKLAEEQNRQTALEVRKAELEIERYDRLLPGKFSVPLTDNAAEETP
jgi:multidrug resistance efflux pump